MNIFITGISGFVGSYLLQYLREKNSQNSKISGTYLFEQEIQSNLAGLTENVNLYACDVSKQKDIEQLIEKERPDILYHLAGVAYVPYAEKNRTDAFMINTLSALYILEAIRKNKLKTKVILISTSEVYGKVGPEEIPIREDHVLNPCNCYASSKAAMEMIAKNAINYDEAQVIIMRPFNHIGPKQSDAFAISNFCRQIALIKLERKAPLLEVGSLDPRRDFTDVRDIVRGYTLAATKGRIGETYNICSGHDFSIREIVDLLIEISGLKIQIVQKEDRIRKIDLPILRGDFNKFEKDTYWNPKIDLKSSLKDTIEYWIGREKAHTQETEGG